MSRFAKVHEAVAAEKSKRLDAYHARVCEIADGGSPSVEDILSTLAAAEKTLEDLDADVGLRERRRALVERMGLAANCDVEQREVDAAIQAAAEKLETARKKYDATVNPLIARREAIAARRQSTSAARSELLRSASPELLARQETLGQRRVEWQERQRRLHESVRIIEANVRQIAESINLQRTDEAKRYREREHAAEAERLNQVRLALTEHDATKTELDNVEAEIRNEMLKV